MKRILLTIAVLGVALASTASAHPHGCYPHSNCWFYPTYCYADYDDCDYPSPVHHHHKRVIIVP
jgi:hypothetical protein